MSTANQGTDLFGALGVMLGELVRDAVADALEELSAAEPILPVLLTRDQIAQAMGVSTATLHRLVRAGCHAFGSVKRAGTSSTRCWPRSSRGKRPDPSKRLEGA